MKTYRYCNVSMISMISIVCMLISACTPFRQVLFEGDDLLPPQLMAVMAPDGDRVEVHFDEAVRSIEGTVRLSAGLTPLRASSRDTVLVVMLEEEQRVGVLYQLAATVEDMHGNSLDFVVEFYGHNPQPPLLRINEFTPQGSGKHPDLVELYAYEAGNLGGLTLYSGSLSMWGARIVFPALWVAAGDYIVVHFKPQGIAAEVDEIEERDRSGGYDAHADAWDFWVPEASGLPSNNGTLLLTRQPGGDLLDALIYSNRRSDSDERYRGFGSRKMVEWVDEIVALGGWRIAGDVAAPEDAIDPEDSTATRSIARSSDSADNDSHADWHITPTRGATFGMQNGDEVYVKRIR